MPGAQGLHPEWISTTHPGRPTVVAPMGAPGYADGLGKGLNESKNLDPYSPPGTTLARS